MTAKTRDGPRFFLLVLLLTAAATAACRADTAYLYDSVNYSVSIALPFANTPVAIDGGALGFRAYRGEVSVKGTRQVLAQFLVAINIRDARSVPTTQRDVGSEFGSLFAARFGVEKGLDKVAFHKDTKPHGDFVIYSTGFVPAKTAKGQDLLLQANILVDKKKRFTVELTIKAWMAKLNAALSKQVSQVLEGVRRGMVDTAGVS